MRDPRNIEPAEVEAAVTDLRRELDQLAARAPQRLDCSPDSIERDLARLVLSVIELLRRLLERQAIRRMEGGTLTDQQVEEMGQALMKLEKKIRELAELFGLKPEDLNLDLGPLGKLTD